VRVVHDPSGSEEGTVLATEVETADTVTEQARGLMGRTSLPEEYALVFRFEEPPAWLPGPLTHWRSIHMLFVRVPLDVLWVLDGTVTKTTRAPPWIGVGLGRGDTVVELPAGAAEDVSVGDRVGLEESTA
jgi:uncharacterized membrane protein (UPF0127 family)